MNKRRAVFLDRDGVLNKEIGDYVALLSDFEILEKNFQALQVLQKRGYLFIVITNQGGLAKGLYSEEILAQMHATLLEAFSKYGLSCQEIYYCKHHPDFNGKCLCRKPGSVLLEKALARFYVDPSRSYFIGDRERDRIAAEAAGVQGILIKSNQSIKEFLHLIDE